jgi:hypothetical protein
MFVVALFATLGRTSGQAKEGQPATCELSRLTPRFVPEVSEATGQNTVVIRLLNHGRACVVRGYPVVRLRDRHGLIPFRIHYGGDQMVTNARPRRLVIALGYAVVVALNNYRCDLGFTRIATLVGLGIANAPRTGIAIHLPRRHQLAYCGVGDPGSIVSVSPFEPTPRAALR